MKRFMFRLLHPRSNERPEEAFDGIIAERRKRYAELKEMVAKVLFLRNKLEASLFERRAEVARIHAQARTAARAGDDPRALLLLGRMRDAKARVAEAEEELCNVRREARAVKADLAEVRESIAMLQQERTESRAKLQSAEVRRALQTVRAETAEADRRLESVRALVARTSAEASLERELERGDVDELPDPTLRLELMRLRGR